MSSDKIEITDEMLENFGAKPKAVKADAELDKVWADPNLTEENLTNASAASAKEEETVMKQSGKTVVDFSEKTSKKKFSLGKLVIIIFVVLIVGLCAFGVWNRWFRADDAKDIVSKWQIDGTDKIVNIDKKKIYLGENATYDYTIDTFSKIIYIQIGNMKGKCHYRFSWDRCQLAFIENAGDNAISTAFSDIKWAWDNATCNMSGVSLSPAYTKSGDRDTSNTGIDEILNNGQQDSVLLDKLSTKKSDE